MKKKADFNNLLAPALVVLLVVASFLAGSLWTKIRGLEEERVKITKEAQPTNPPAAPTRPPFTPKKSEKPVVKFFVMAFCPFGNQAETGLEPVCQLLKNKVDWQPRYVIYKDYCERTPADQKAKCEKDYCFKKGSKIYCSMHGVAELNQDIRELCAFNLEGAEKFWKFVSSTNKNCNVSNIETCWKTEAKNAGLNIAKIENCFSSQKFALAKVQTEEMDKYRAFGSPAVFINDVSYEGGRAPEDYKKAICSSFENPPEECQKVLGQESEAVAGGCN